MTKDKALSKPKVVAAIPCHNEERFIADIAASARQYVDQVVVIDDGSSDGTSQAAKAAGAAVVQHRANRGPGEAYRSCFEVARSLDADFLITLDGDGQHLPHELPRILGALVDDRADVVIGSRFLDDYELPRYRKFGIDVITWLYNLGSDVRVADAQSCYRGYSRAALDTLHITESGFGFSVELLVQARNKDLVIQEVPISCVYHPHGHSMNPVLHGVSVALMVIKHRLKSLAHRLGDGSGREGRPPRSGFEVRK